MPIVKTYNSAKMNYKHNSGTIYKIFTLFRAGVDLILHLLFICKSENREENFQKLYSPQADNVYRKYN